MSLLSRDVLLIGYQRFLTIIWLCLNYKTRNTKGAFITKRTSINSLPGLIEFQMSPKAIGIIRRGYWPHYQKCKTVFLNHWLDQRLPALWLYISQHIFYHYLQASTKMFITSLLVGLVLGSVEEWEFLVFPAFLLRENLSSIAAQNKKLMDVCMLSLSSVCDIEVTPGTDLNDFKLE